MAYLAHGIWIDIKEATVEGIRRISNADLSAARDLGYKIKLIGVIRRSFTKIMFQLESIRPWFQLMKLLPKPTESLMVLA